MLTMGGQDIHPLIHGTSRDASGKRANQSTTRSTSTRGMASTRKRDRLLRPTEQFLPNTWANLSVR